MKPSIGNPIEYIFIHHTAVSYKQNPDQWDQTNTFHKSMWNFKSSLGIFVGYTYEISASGFVRQARAEGEETAAVIGFNRKSVSICLDGNFDIEKPTLAQVKALRTLIINIMARTNVPITNVLPHRSECGTPPYKTCYGSQLSNTWAQDIVLKPAEFGITDDQSLGSEQVIERDC